MNYVVYHLCKKKSVKLRSDVSHLTGETGQFVSLEKRNVLFDTESSILSLLSVSLGTLLYFY